MEIRKISDDYFIDSDCNVYSRPRPGVNGGALKPKTNADGYRFHRMTLGGKKCNRLAHRLLAEVFIPNPKNKPQINHKDGNKLNNSIENLEWSTSSENVQHAWATGLRSKRASSGERYIYLEKQTQRYRVIVSHQGGETRLGRYPTLREAISVRDAFISKLQSYD